MLCINTKVMKQKSFDFYSYGLNEDDNFYEKNQNVTKTSVKSDIKIV